MALFLNILYLLLQARSMTPQIHKTYVIDGHLRLDWKESMEKCRQSGMQLVSIESREEGEMLKKLIEPSQSYEGDVFAEMDFWTGGVLNDDRQWIWSSSGLPFVYTDWAPGSPSDRSGGAGERCMKLWGHHHLQWDDFPCSARLHYICQKNLLTFTRTTERLVWVQPTTTPTTQVVQIATDEESNLEEKDEDFSTTFTSLVNPYMFGASDFNLSDYEFRILDIPSTTTTAKQLIPSYSHAIVMHTLKFFIFNKERLRWHDARRHCHSQKMNLAAVANSEELCKLTQFMKDQKLDQMCYWIRKWDLDSDLRGDGHEDYHRRRFTNSRNVELVRNPRQGSKQFDNKCPLILPATEKMLLRECWIRCAFVCEKIEDSP